ncbi:MAG: DUF2851 family protein [Ignavibacteriae bacterium]|nr:DUF2851 family protein [Ignavibacteriota bacterium]
MSLPNVPERFLRHIWQHQLFSADLLRTADGKQVNIISPGVVNTDGGPDFNGAKIRVGNITFHGDVELHKSASEWNAHKHDLDPHYNRVILHVVMTAEGEVPPARTPSHRSIPLLILHPFLDETLRETWENTLFEEQGGRASPIKCYTLNDRIPLRVIVPWMEKLAHERIELKVRRFEERLKQLIDESNHIVHEPYPRYYGNPDDIPPPRKDYTRKDFANRTLWEQLLYEGIMEALGYSKNREAFLRLAQSMRLASLRQHQLGETHTMMALLFGAAGLLPSVRTLEEKESRQYVLQLKMIWNTIRPNYKAPILSPGEWLFFRLRPSNFPTARLAAMSFLLPKLFAEDNFRRLITIFKNEGLTERERLDSFHTLLAFESDEFWKHHYRFGNATRKAATSLGHARINEIASNVLVPIVLLYARIFKDHSVRMHAHKLLSSLAVSQKNTISNVIQRQLLKNKSSIDSALLQQGAIQLHKFYCLPGRCGECEVGKLLHLTNS